MGALSSVSPDLQLQTSGQSAEDPASSRTSLWLWLWKHEKGWLGLLGAIRLKELPA